jgi:hypothetical protein
MIVQMARHALRSMGVAGRPWFLTSRIIGPIPAEPSPAILVKCADVSRVRTARRGRPVMSRALVLGAAAVALSAVSASAQVYGTPDYGYGYATPVADLAPPAYGYAAPPYVTPAPVYAAPSVYAAPVYQAPVYAAPVYAAPPVYVAPPAYAAPRVYAAPPVTTGYYTAPPIPPEPIYDYAPGYYGYGWR